MVATVDPTYTLWIVEDNPQINRLFQKYFNGSGIQTDSVISVKQALRHLHEGFIPDVMILDLELIDGDGTQILDDMLRHKLTHTQVVIVSAHAYSKDYALDHYPMVRDVLVKPVSPRGLSALIHQLLNQNAYSG